MCTNFFRLYDFKFIESFYGNRLWEPLLNCLFEEAKGFCVESEYVISKIDPSYPKLRADFAIGIQGKKFAPPIIFIELSCENLSGTEHGHKDELKMGYSLGSSLLKLLSLNWGREKEFLEKLRTYGLLPGGTSYDICSMYPVFPNADKSDFYFVFDYSKTQLRFHILEDNMYSYKQRFCNGAADQIHIDPEYEHGPNPVHIPIIDTDADQTPITLDFDDVGITIETDPNDEVAASRDFVNHQGLEQHPRTEAEEGKVMSASETESPNEYDTSIYFPPDSSSSPSSDDQSESVEEEQEETPKLPVKSRKEIECLHLFKEGHINESALRVLERLAELVLAQKELLKDMQDTPNPDDKFKYDISRIMMMLSSRTSHSRPSPLKKQEKRTFGSNNEDNFPSKKRKLTSALTTTVLSSEFESLLKKVSEEGQRNLGNDENDLNTGNSLNAGGEKNISIVSGVNPDSMMELREPKNTIFIFKNSSKHEISIYNHEVVRRSTCFPKFVGYSTDYEGKEYENDIRIELEQVIPGDKFDLIQFHDSASLFGAKFLVDIFGALMTLHSIGYVHGDVTPGNVGFNEELGVWQLFDFDNSRPIEEAARGKGDYHGTPELKSKHYQETGKYGPFDDFVGTIKTLMLFLSHIEFYAEMFQTYESRKCFDFFVENLIKRVKPFSHQKIFNRIYFEAVKLLWKKCKKNPREPSILNSKQFLTNPNFFIK